jgi:glycosyltransferase involved in cell wall biosynthesis
VPMLSIIIPTFNSSKIIGRCLKSIERQTLTDLEIVVQDGESTDNTVDRVQKFQKWNREIPVLLESRKDHGIYDAMNRAVARADGEWLLFLGSDDELYDKHVLEAMLSPEHVSGHDVLYGNVRVVGKCIWAKDGSIYDGPFDLAKLLNRNICHQAMFYRSTFARRAGKFNVDYVVCSDWDFNLRCWSLTAFKYVDLTVANFYAGGISNDRRDVRFYEDVATNVIRYFDISPLDPRLNTTSFAGYQGIVEIQRATARE